MRENFYRLQFNITSSKRKFIQRLFLIAALVLDFFCIVFIIDAAIGSLNYLLLSALMLILSTLLRVLSMRLNYNYNYTIRGNRVLISRSMSMSSKIIAQFTACEVQEIVQCDKLFSENEAIYALGNQEEIIPAFCITVNNKRIIIHIDDYLMAVLICGGAQKNAIL